MTFEETINAYCKHYGAPYDKEPFTEKLAFVARQWGAFVAWIVEQRNTKITVHIEGGVCQDVTGLPKGWDWILDDKD